MGILLDDVKIDENSNLILNNLTIRQGRILLEMFATMEEYGMLRKDMAEVYDLLKRQIPQ